MSLRQVQWNSASAHISCKRYGLGLQWVKPNGRRSQDLGPGSFGTMDWKAQCLGMDFASGPMPSNWASIEPIGFVHGFQFKQNGPELSKFMDFLDHQFGLWKWASCWFCMRPIGPENLAKHVYMGLYWALIEPNGPQVYSMRPNGLASKACKGISRPVVCTWLSPFDQGVKLTQ